MKFSDRVGLKSWALESSARRNMSKNSEASSIQQCGRCYRWYLSTLLTPTVPGDCGCKQGPLADQKSSHTLSRPDQHDNEYHGGYSE